MRRLLLCVLAALLLAPATASAATLVVGDSLAVGMRASLPDEIGPDIVWDAVSGRTTPDGMIGVRRALRSVRPADVIISLGTNDGTSPVKFRSRLRRTLRRLPRTACVAWSDIHRPARKGAYAALNRVLRAERRRDDRLFVVPWHRAVKTGRVALPDGLHPDEAGYAVRSRLFAAALDRCHRQRSA